MRATRTLFALVLAASATVLVGCGDDGGSASAYCDVIAELEASDAEPTEDNLNQVLAAAPSEIKDDVKTLVDAFNSDDQDEAFTEEDVIAAGQSLDEFDAENCDDSDSDSGSDSEE